MAAVAWLLTKELTSISIQRWWDEFQHELWYHRPQDEAYMRHHFREEVKRNLQDVIRY